MVRKYRTTTPLAAFGITAPLVWDGSQELAYLWLFDDPSGHHLESAVTKGQTILFRWYADTSRLKTKELTLYEARVARNKEFLRRFPQNCLPVLLAPRQFDQEALATLLKRYESYTRFGKSLSATTAFFNAAICVHDFMGGLPSVDDGLDKLEVASDNDPGIFYPLPPPPDPSEIFVSDDLRLAREIAPVLTKAVDSWQMAHGPVSPEQREYVIRALLSFRIDRESSWIEAPSASAHSLLVNHGLITRRLGVLKDDSDFCLSTLLATVAAEDTRELRRADFSTRCACQRFRLLGVELDDEADAALDRLDEDEEDDDESEGAV